MAYMHTMTIVMKPQDMVDSILTKARETIKGKLKYWLHKFVGVEIYPTNIRLRP